MGRPRQEIVRQSDLARVCVLAGLDTVETRFVLLQAGHGLHSRGAKGEKLTADVLGLTQSRFEEVALSVAEKIAAYQYALTVPDEPPSEAAAAFEQDMRKPAKRQRVA